MMTSRERVLTAFAHQEPDRVPAWCGASVEFWAKAKETLGVDDEGLRRRFHDDFRRVTARDGTPSKPLTHPRANTRTVFGVEREGLGYGQPVHHPLAGASLDEVHAYPWPDPVWVVTDGIGAEARAYSGEYAILGGDWSPFWHDAIDLLGMENLMVDMLERPDVVHALMGHITDYYVASSERIFSAAGKHIDIFFIGNDFGSQHGPLLSEPLFRAFILPHLERLIRLGHDHGMKVMLHCCGGIYELLPAMIEVELDAIHAVQPCCYGMDLRQLKHEYGDRLVFNGGIDSQHVLIEGTVEIVRRRTRDILEIMKPGGGYIAGASHDSILEETPVENVLAMFETIHEYGAYQSLPI